MMMTVAIMTATMMIITVVMEVLMYFGCDCEKRTAVDMTRAMMIVMVMVAMMMRVMVPMLVVMGDGGGDCADDQ